MLRFFTFTLIFLLSNIQYLKNQLLMKKFLLFSLLAAFSSGSFAQATRLVLYEEFSGENCAPCAAINPDVNAMLDQYPNDVVLLKYQVNIPTAGPLYYQNSSQVNTRKSYYGVNQAPWGEQDGNNSDAAGHIHPYYWVNDQSYLTNRSAVASPFNLTAVHIFSSDADSFYLTVNIAEASAVNASASSKLKLQVAMIEDLSFLTPPGNNGETEFHHVMRKMYPSPTGTILANAWTSGQTQTLTFSGPFPTYIYDKTKVRFVVFIQDDGTKEVHQAAISDAQSLTRDAKPAEITNGFISCTGGFSPTVSLTNNGSQTLTQVDLNVYIDNVFAVTYPWVGGLGAGASTNVTITGISGVSGGSHSVKIITANPNGFADLNNGNDTAKSNFAIGTSPTVAPLTEGFETGGSAGWLVENSDNGPTWTVASTGSSSSKSYKMDFYSSSAGQIDYLYAPRVSLVGFANATIKFDRAFAVYPYWTSATAWTPLNDELDIQVSTNCGDTWQTVYSKSGTTLSTTDTTRTDYSPAASDWKADSASLTPFAGNADVLIRFKGLSDYGNNLYIDNINIYQFGAVVSGVEEVAAQLTSVFPNPANDVLNASIALDKASEVSLSVFNMMGQKLISISNEMNAGLNPVTINTSELAQGSYTLELTINGNRTLKQFNIVR